MRLRPLFLAAGIAFLTIAALGQSAEFYPVELVKPGQKGTGRTIFSGASIEDFDVEILGVLNNFGPKQSLVLARLSGGRIDETGVFEGMSGSPVYLEGRLLGAVAFSFPFSREAIAGITPIGEMVEVFKSRPPKARPAASRSLDPRRIHEIQQSGPAAVLQGLPQRAADIEPGRLRRIATPLNFSGFDPRAIEQFAPTLRALGLTPVRGMAGSGTDYPLEPLAPGSTISVDLVRGDMEVGASGTVTHINGDKIYAFGHPFLSLGAVQMPMNQAAVVAVIPSLQSSQKISVSQKPIGSLEQDRSTGIYGRTGVQPSMIPIRLRLETSRNDLREYSYEVVNDSFLTPFMLNLTINNAILASERSLGGQTLQVKCDIKLRGQPNVIYQSNISDTVSSPALAAITLSAPVSLLLASGFEDLDFQEIQFDLVSAEETREAELLKVWQDKLEAKAGEDVQLTVFLRRENGEIVTEKHAVRIPEGVSPGPLLIDIGDGISVSRNAVTGSESTFVPESLSQLVKAINNLKKNDRLYVRLYREEPGAVVAGEGMPGLPPSILQLYGSRKTAGEVGAIRRVVFMEYELSSKEYALSGHKQVRIEVKG